MQADARMIFFMLEYLLGGYRGPVNGPRIRTFLLGSNCRSHSSQPQLLQPFKELDLSRQNLCLSAFKIEPLGAVNLRKGLKMAATGWPLDFEGVTCNSCRVEFTLSAKRNHALATALPDLPQPL